MSASKAEVPDEHSGLKESPSQEKEATGTKDANEAAAKEEETQKKDFDELVSVFGKSGFLTVVSGAMLFSARPAIAKAQFPDDARLIAFLTRLASVGAAFEFFTNPIFGKLSDSYGRKPIVPLGALSVAIGRSILFFNHKRLWPMVLEQAIAIPMTTSFFVTYRAALADKLKGSMVAQANAIIGAYIGLSIIVGPMIAEAVMKYFEPRYCYAVSACIASCNLALLTTKFKETLPPEKRVELPLGQIISDMQPFSFSQMMKFPVIRRCMMSIGLQSLNEGRSINDVMALTLNQSYGYDWMQINRFVGFFGVGLVIGGLTAKPMMANMGLRKFTTFSNVLNCLGWYIFAALPPFTWFCSKGWCPYLGSTLNIPASRKRDAAEAIIMTIGAKEGFGKGFMSGCMNNFRAVINIIGPLLYGGAFARGKKMEFPGLVFVVAAILCMLSELPFVNLSNKQLGLDDKGQLEKDAP